MQKKMYISNLDTPRGYHIAQYFRQDHLSNNPTLQIVGSSSSPTLITGVTSQIDFCKYPQIACRTVLDSDIVILDLILNSHQAEVIIRFLQHAVDSSSKKIRIVGLSSVLTWEGMKAFELQSQSSDRQTMMGNILDQNKWKSITYSDRDYRKRVPGHFSTKCYQLQNLLLGLNQKENIQATVVTCGVLYGKQNSEMQPEIVNALSNKKMTIWGSSSNFIPLLHIQSFLQSLEILIKSNIEYSIIVDSKTLTQKTIKQMIIKVCGSKSELKKKDPLFITKQENIWTFALKFKPSKIVEQICSNRNFQEYCNQGLLHDLCEYTQWKPKQAILFIDKVEQRVMQIYQQVQKHIEVIKQQQIDRLNQELKQLHFPPQSEPQAKRQSRGQKVPEPIEIPDYYKEVMEKLLSKRKCHSYLIMAHSKMQLFITKEYFFDNLIQLVKQKEQQTQYTQIAFDSEEYYNYFGIKRTVNQQQAKTDQVQQIDTKQVYNIHKIPKKDEKLQLTTQYLMDNVLIAISAAKFKMKSKSKQSLGDLIDELKNIWARGNYRASIDELKRKEYFGEVASLI